MHRVAQIANIIKATSYFLIPSILILYQYQFGHLFPRQQTRTRLAFIGLFLSLGAHQLFEAFDINGALHLTLDIAGAIFSMGAIYELLVYRERMREIVAEVQDGGDAQTCRE